MTHPTPNTNEAAGELLREVARLCMRAERVVTDRCETTSTQCHILSELGRNGPMPMSDLGARLLLEKSWVSRAIDNLVQLELVAKTPNPLDARSWLLGLTATGKRRLKELDGALDEHAEQLLGTLCARDRQTVHHALQLLQAALRQDPNATCCLPAPSPAVARKE